MVISDAIFIEIIRPTESTANVHAHDARQATELY